MFKLVHHKLSASQGAASAPAEQPQNLTFQKLISSANNTTRSAEGPRTPCLSWNRVFRASLDPLKVSATVLSRNRVAPTAPPTPPLATSHVPAETFSMSIATPAAGSGANPGPGHLPQAGVEPLDSKILPGRLQNLRACLLCRLVKTEVQFAEDGCDNCPEVRLGTVAQFTSPTFQGFVGIYKPEKSWVARWQRQSGLTRTAAYPPSFCRRGFVGLISARPNEPGVQNCISFMVVGLYFDLSLSFREISRLCGYFQL